MDSVPSLGFQKVVTIEQLREQHPLLDMVDHNRKARVQVRTPGTSSSSLPVRSEAFKLTVGDQGCLICSSEVTFTLKGQKKEAFYSDDFDSSRKYLD